MNEALPLVKTSWWFDEAMADGSNVQPTSLTGKTDADVVVIGGGFTGLWTALHLKEGAVPDNHLR